MNTDADILVVGAGHNSLIAAAYLATAGKKVLVLERNDYPGGGVASAELAEPGFLDELHSLIHVRILPNPVIADDELGLLSRYGLEYIPIETPHAAIFEDGTFIPICRDRAQTMERIRQISPRDADAYDRFMDLAVGIVEHVTPGFFVPPIPRSQQVAGLEKTHIGQEILRVTGMSVTDVLAEWFVDHRVRIALARMASELTLAHPDDLNTGMITFLAPGLNELYGMALPRGGGSAFTAACVRCIEDHGGEVRTSVHVEKVLSRDGRAVGVRTGEGSELTAKDAVLASIHPYRLGDMVEGLDVKTARRAARTTLAPYSAFVVHASLEEPLRFKADPEADNVIWNTVSPTSLDSVTESFDDMRRGRLPRVPMLEAGCPSVADPSRAPEGMANLHMLSLTSLNLADGGPARWRAIQEEYCRRLFDRLAGFTNNLRPGLVRAQAFITPLDHELNSLSFAGGDYTGVASFGHQMGDARPTRELSGYAVPGVKGLYLTGPFMHPGGGVVGGGRPTAIRMFADLDIPFGPFRRSATATPSPAPAGSTAER
ncbi:phytoene desaturase family protein [Amycolatopsis pithecellobii]|uniref:Pyridine nucleotide-disulfide oxidoreductase domain-containing protein 2 n=1 Tax=Amycolatopsis pithecellobii TaxID=664692 RepID=A0A6N7YRI6_9PSEU|nr:NAD(P)/FAD-dependent oxidoreductase [Amycolatopsis pithecellobii]MTD55635.1 FAD-dependent oxidoreductase [Amycolatopsis pithecellobii]